MRPPSHNNKDIWSDGVVGHRICPNNMLRSQIGPGSCPGPIELYSYFCQSCLSCVLVTPIVFLATNSRLHNTCCFFLYCLAKLCIIQLYEHHS